MGISELVLAAWMRLKYPHVAVGALASSAPILQFEDIVPPATFYDIVSNAFKVCCSWWFTSIHAIVFLIGKMQINTCSLPDLQLA